jgi:tetrapyrrole methylase family protein / MazG family protein
VKKRGKSLRSKSRDPRPARPERLLPLTRRDREAGEWFARLVALQARLRATGGCPWDREQTHESLRKFLIEETYEVLDAMDLDDPRKFESELGDLLLQIVFHSILAEEERRFTIAGVIRSVHEKMVRRHPHVFGDKKAANSAEVLRNWEQLKAEERAAEANGASGETAGASLLDGIPRSLPAAIEANQLTQRASHIGFDWQDIAGVLEKLEEEKCELESVVADRTSANLRVQRLEEEAGDLLFAAVNVARFLGVDPEIALKRANDKFKRRFQWMEAVAAREGRRLAEVPRERMEELWNESKAGKPQR